MSSDSVSLDAAKADGRPGRVTSGRDPAEADVTALYQIHALGLTRLAHVMLGDKAAAEDVVQDAFCGLYRNWHRLADPANAMAYLRASVLNKCRSAIRRRRLRAMRVLHEPAAASAESAVLAGDERRSVLAAVRMLPARQREALILRFYLLEPDAEIARVMGISQATVRSTTHRALAALGRKLEGTS